MKGKKMSEITITPASVDQRDARAALYVSPASLDRALRTAMIAASTDSTMTPILRSVAITVTEAGTLVATATDRYWLVRAEIEKSGESDAPEFIGDLATRPAVISLDQVKILLQWLKPHTKFPRGKMAMVIREDRMHFSWWDGTEFPIVLVDGDYPKLSTLVNWPMGGDDEGAGEFAFSGPVLDKLGKLGKLTGKGGNTYFRTAMGPNGNAKGIQFRGYVDHRGTGAKFDGVVMPVRIDERDPRRDSDGGL